MIKAVLFDMDGVLIDAKEWHYDALNQALSLFGALISRDEHIGIYDGLPTKKKLKMLSENHGLPKNLHEFICSLKQQYTHDIVFERCTPKFHHQNALKKLKDEGYKLALCSNSIRKSVDLMLDKASLSDYFDLTLSNEDIHNPKPDPEIYERAISHFGLEPQECLIVEDNPHGVKAGKASGAHVLVVATTEDVTIDNISKEIRDINNNSSARSKF